MSEVARDSDQCPPREDQRRLRALAVRGRMHVVRRGLYTSAGLVALLVPLRLSVWHGRLAGYSAPVDREAPLLLSRFLAWAAAGLLALLVVHVIDLRSAVDRFGQSARSGRSVAWAPLATLAGVPFAVGILFPGAEAGRGGGIVLAVGILAAAVPFVLAIRVHRRGTSLLSSAQQSGYLNPGLTREEMLSLRKLPQQRAAVQGIATVPPRPSLDPGEELAICCSGGGIRSATFCLGALQELDRRGVYARAKTVYAVSGGAYIATAYAVLRARLRKKYGPGWPLPYAPGSPEAERLRRSSHYLLPDARVAAYGTFSLLFGLLVNVALLAASIRAVSWLLGWALARSNVICDFNTSKAHVSWTGANACRTDGQWRLSAPPLQHGISVYHLVWVIPVVLGLLMFVIDKVSDRFAGYSRRVARASRTGVSITGLGLLLAALLVGVPQALVWLNNAAVANSPTTTVATVIRGLGFTTTDGCRQAWDRSFADAVNGAREEKARTGEDVSFRFGACGAAEAASTKVYVAPPDTVPGAPGSFDKSGVGGQSSSFLALLAALFAMVKRTVRPGSKSDAGADSLRSKAMALGRNALPWAGSGIVAVMVGLTLLRWTRDYALDPARLVRWHVAWLIVGILVAVKIFTDANRTSLHPFYRERLASAFSLQRTGTDPDGAVPDGDLDLFSGPHRRTHRDRGAPDGHSGPGLSPEDEGHEHGPLLLSSLIDARPALVLCGVANVVDPDAIPPERRATPFRFAADTVGLSDTQLPGGSRLVKTDLYETAADAYKRDLTLLAATAVSGAAFAPLTGREAASRPLRILLAVANARLGVWLPNPAWVDPSEPRTYNKHLTWLHNAISKPGPFRLLREAVGDTCLDDRSLYCTDGGHYDNLGLIEALRARPDVVIVLDASADKPNSFAAIAEAIATARMDLRVSITGFDPAPLHLGTNQRARAATATALATWPDGKVARLYFVKNVVPEQVTYDLVYYNSVHPDFPHHTTSDQLFGEWDFEAYRALGEQATAELFSGSNPLDLVIWRARPTGKVGQSPGYLRLGRSDAAHEIAVDDVDKVAELLEEFGRKFVATHSWTSPRHCAARIPGADAGHLVIDVTRTWSDIRRGRCSVRVSLEPECRDHPAIDTSCSPAGIQEMVQAAIERLKDGTHEAGAAESGRS